jgi:hypothetical protein
MTFNSFNISRSGANPTPIRYVLIHKRPYFLANDVFDPFINHINKTFDQVWAEDFSEDVCHVLSKNMLETCFPEDPIPESPTNTDQYEFLKRTSSGSDSSNSSTGQKYKCFARNDVIKIILLLPIPFEQRSNCLEAFLLYYKAHAQVNRVLKRSPLASFVLLHHNALLFVSFVIGFLFALFIFVTFHVVPLKTR